MIGITKHRRAGHRRVVQALAAVSVVALLASCSQELRKHGYIPPPEDLEQIKVGVSTRDSVVETIGTPSSQGVLEESGYIYVTDYARKYGFRAQQIVRREALLISFDGRGVVSNVERFDLSDGRVVVLDRRVTDTGATDNTFLRQLIGNLGNFNPALASDPS
ncbi:MAG: outer membrane protein assembly factor BamE [Paracoccaceae bacterium]